MGFWLTFFLFVGSFVVGELLRPRPKVDTPQPSGLGDINLPTADATRVIPIVYGTVLLRGPNTVWYGDLYASPIKQKVRTSLFSSKAECDLFRRRSSPRCASSLPVTERFSSPMKFRPGWVARDDSWRASPIFSDRE